METSRMKQTQKKLFLYELGLATAIDKFPYIFKINYEIFVCTNEKKSFTFAVI